MDRAEPGAVPHLRDAADVQVNGTRDAVAQSMGNPHSPGPAAVGGRSNVRTALVLLSIAVVFFLGIIAKHWLFG